MDIENERVPNFVGRQLVYEGLRPIGPESRAVDLLETRGN